MRRLVPLALLVPLVAGCAGSSVHTHVYPSATVRPVPRWIKVEHLSNTAIRGAALFESAGCIACRTYAGSGSSNLHAPDLTAIGRHHLGIRFEIAHLRCPSCVNPDSPMPPFRSLGRRRLHQLAVFLEASRGIH